MLHSRVPGYALPLKIAILAALASAGNSAHHRDDR
jgi:hypothetical protein